MEYSIITKDNSDFDYAINYFKQKNTLYATYIVTDYCLDAINFINTTLTRQNCIENNSNFSSWIIKYKDRYFKCTFDKSTLKIKALFKAKYYSAFVSNFFNCKLLDLEHKYL